MRHSFRIVELEFKRVREAVGADRVTPFILSMFSVAVRFLPDEYTPPELRPSLACDPGPPGFPVWSIMNPAGESHLHRASEAQPG
jgi:hypothetical protein